MNVHFYSKSNDYEIDFFTDAKEKNGYIEFKDESIDNSFIKMKSSNNELYFDRYGDVSMKIKFKEGMKSSGKYKNVMGLEFEFEAMTKKLKIDENTIELLYDLLIDNEYNNSCEIIVKINN